jgi:heat shock protein HslJ
MQRSLGLLLFTGASLMAAGPVRYDCQSGEYLMVRYETPRKGLGRAILEVTGRPRLVLSQTASGSGARYSDGYTVLWNKGREVTLESGDFHPTGCSERLIETTALQAAALQAESALSGKWILTELSGKAVQLDRPAFLEFLTGSMVGGNLGCNRFSGSYQQSGASLSFSPLAVTRMACLGPAMQIEEDTGKALAATASWRINRQGLSLMDARGKVLSVWKRE